PALAFEILAGFELAGRREPALFHGVIHPVQQKRHPTTVTFEKGKLQLRVPLADAAADDIRHRNHILQRMRYDVAEQQVIAETIADLRHFSRGRGGVEPDGYAEFLQAGPYRVEISRMPGHVP